MKTVDKFLSVNGYSDCGELCCLCGISRQAVYDRKKNGWLVGWANYNGLDVVVWQNKRGQIIIDEGAMHD